MSRWRRTPRAGRFEPGQTPTRAAYRVPTPLSERSSFQRRTRYKYKKKASARTRMPTPSASVSPTRSARISHPYLTPVSPHAHISHVPADAIPTRSRFKQPDTISLQAARHDLPRPHPRPRPRPRLRPRPRPRPLRRRQHTLLLRDVSFVELYARCVMAGAPPPDRTSTMGPFQGTRNSKWSRG